MRSAGTSPSQGSDQNYAHYVTFLFPECPTCSTVPLSHYNVNIALEGPLRIQQAAREAATNAPPLQVYLWPFELESGVRVTCDMGYLCANFSLPRPLYFWLRPDVRDRQTSDVRQTDVRRTSSLNAPDHRAGGGVKISRCLSSCWLEIGHWRTCWLYQNVLRNCLKLRIQLLQVRSRQHSSDTVFWHCNWQCVSSHFHGIDHSQSEERAAAAGVVELGSTQRALCYHTE